MNARPVHSLSGASLRLAQAGWVVIALLSLALVVLSLGDFLSGSKLFWQFDDPPSPTVVRDGLDQLGIAPSVYVAYGIAFLVIRAAAMFLIGLLLFVRRFNELIAILVAYLLVVLPSGDNSPAILHDMWRDEPLRAAAAIVVGMVAFALLMVLLLVFPDGRFTPPWTRIVAVAWVTMGVGAYVFWGSPLDILTWLSPLTEGFIPLCVALAVIAQVWRYRHTSSPVQRQQTKWFALGIAVLLIEFALTTIIMDGFTADYWPTAKPSHVVLADLALHTIHQLAFLAVPLTLAIAILRYRLWDLGILVNRALVYGSLSAALAAVYLALVVLFQELLQSMTGSGSDLAIAASTLITAALFRPLRGRLQGAIDRRFYRHRYDAARTVATFGTALRDEMDLERIQDSLLAAVRDTVQPAHASLWLRTSDRPARTR